MIGAILKLIIFTSMVNKIINTSRNERVTQQVYDTYLLLLNCRQNARWTETTDSCFTNCSTQNAFCSGVTIIVLLHHRPREKSGVGLRMRTKLEHLLFHSIWETYVCVRFESRNGRLKPLQSFWYTRYMETAFSERMLNSCSLFIAFIWDMRKLNISRFLYILCFHHSPLRFMDALWLIVMN
jgi:hypothetical protein